ncbi:type II toxin-antitoxin system prevent-host-death family antitoxin [Jannaschia sp. Os4]|nr:type II toxin-antitoxin system prevent-host-death family antitoxin [Jannaschia sp. Os4]MBM2578039.1 type II toxin-antitoxin system prevent-host-death family antitoxin [Jannaschia sp. Os4]
MRTVNIHEAKTHLSRLVEAARRGEDIVIAKAGTPLVKIVGLSAEEAAGRRIGFLDAAVPDDFDTMGGDEIAAAFGG